MNEDEDDGLIQFYLGDNTGRLTSVKNSYIDSTNIEDRFKITDSYFKSLFALLSVLYRSQYADKYLVICLQDRKLYIGKFIEIRPALDISDYSSCLFVGSEFGERIDCSDINNINILDFKDRESAILYAEIAD